ncbi:hypothetical protein [Alteromonas sp. a30]|nr:hypothetical protein [Alteromonas sp. a30]
MMIIAQPRLGFFIARALGRVDVAVASWTDEAVAKRARKKAGV